MLLIVYYYFDKYQPFEYHYRIARNTLSEMIPETCESIYAVLRQEFRKVSEQTRLRSETLFL